MRTLILAFICTAAFAEPVAVFTSGDDDYHTYRIPAIVTAADGSLLVFAEARRENRGDPGQGDIDLVCKRSTDRGATWSAMAVIDDPGDGWAASNPTPVVDSATGTIHVLYNRWEPGYGTHNCEAGKRHNQAWIRTSDDNGATWSDARDITDAVRNVSKWPFMYFGPGGAIQMAEGRLVVPAAATVIEGDTTRRASYAVYSDDGGVTWEAGAPSWYPATNECQIVEVFSGYLLMNARQVDGDRSVFFTSSDNGLTWGLWLPGVDVTPVATGWENVVRDDSGQRAVVWTGPAGPGRKAMTVHVDGDIDQYFERVFELDDRPAAYSDLAALGNGDCAMVWETGNNDPYEQIVYTTVSADRIFD